MMERLLEGVTFNDGENFHLYQHTHNQQFLVLSLIIPHTHAPPLSPSFLTLKKKKSWRGSTRGKEWGDNEWSLVIN